VALATLNLIGEKALQRKLAALGRTGANKVLRKALRAGAKVIRTEAQANAPVLTGDLRANIRVRAMKRRKQGVGVRVVVGDGWYQGDQFYGAFLEFGHRVGSRRLGDARATVEPKPFMRPAFDQKKDAAISEIETVLATGIVEEAKRS